MYPFEKGRLSVVTMWRAQGRIARTKCGLGRMQAIAKSVLCRACRPTHVPLSIDQPQYARAKLSLAARDSSRTTTNTHPCRAQTIMLISALEAHTLNAKHIALISPSTPSFHDLFRGNRCQRR